MKKLILTLIVSIAMLSSYGQSEAEVVAQAQLDAYNKRDLNAFVATFSNGASFYSFETGEKTMDGIDAIKNAFADYFEQSPELHSNVEKRIVIGNKVIDHEKITGSRGSEEIREIVMIYEIANGKIVKATSIKP